MGDPDNTNDNETTAAVVPNPLYPHLTSPSQTATSMWSFVPPQDEQELFEEALIPPENFNMVCEHVYRSSFPKKKHFRFLEKLQLKSVL